MAGAAVLPKYTTIGGRKIRQQGGKKKRRSLEYSVLIEEVDGKNRVYSAQTLNRPDGLE